VRLLPPVEPGRAIESSGPAKLRRVRRRGKGKWANLDLIENIGQRIQEIRKLRGLTQNELFELSNVSRSYLARIESGLMTPSLGTLEKISEALGVSLNRFFVRGGEALLEDPFIQGLHPYLHQLDWEQWQSIIRRLAVISNSVGFDQSKLAPFPPRSTQIGAVTRRPMEPTTMSQRQAG
jgi:transcriptional regulator with XRE-family HTH domain